MFRAFSRPSSGAQGLQWQPLVLLSTAVIELLMMGGKTPKTCWAVNKRHDNKLENCCILLVIYLNCSLLCSKEPSTCPFPDSEQYSPRPNHVSWISVTILSTNLHLGLQSGLFPIGFPTKTQFASLVTSIRATYPAHLIFHDYLDECSSLTLRWLMSYIYGAPILDVSRSHTTTQHSR